MSNFGAKLQIRGDDLLVQKDISPNAGNNANVNANLSTEGFELPLTLRLGISYEPIADENQRLLVGVDAIHPNDNTESVSVGAEYSVFQRIFSIRAGYKELFRESSEEQFTVGAGINYAFTPGLALRLDYAFQRFGRLKDIHQFGVAFLFRTGRAGADPTMVATTTIAPTTTSTTVPPTTTATTTTPVPSCSLDPIANLGWDATEALAPLGDKARVFGNLDKLVSQLVADARSGDHVLMMSNGGFGGIHARLLDALHHHYHEDIVLTPMHRYGGYA